MNKIINKLKTLKNIEPDQNYRLRSRSYILSQSPNPENKKWSNYFINNIQISPVFSSSLRFGAGIGLASTFIILGIIGIGFISNQSSPLKSAGLDLKTLKAEAEELKIDITIAEISQYQQSSDTITAALKSASEINNDQNLNSIDSALEKIIQ